MTDPMTDREIATRARADVQEIMLLSLLRHAAAHDADPTGFVGRVMNTAERRVERTGHDDPRLAKATREAFVGLLQAVMLDVLNVVPPKPRR